MRKNKKIYFINGHLSHLKIKYYSFLLEIFHTIWRHSMSLSELNIYQIQLELTHLDQNGESGTIMI